MKKQFHRKAYLAPESSIYSICVEHVIATSGGGGGEDMNPSVLSIDNPFGDFTSPITDLKDLF